MKRFLSAALAVLLSFILIFHKPPPAEAVNTATVQTALPIRTFGSGPVFPYKVAFDTTATDLTIRTPATGNMACIVGWTMSETSATNVTLTSGSTALLALELGANSPVALPIGGGLAFCTQPSEALKMQVSVAVTNMMVYVVELPEAALK